jgi:hypothetical protein
VPADDERPVLSLAVATVRYAAWLKWMSENSPPLRDPYLGAPPDSAVADLRTLADAYLKVIGKWPLEVRSSTTL